MRGTKGLGGMTDQGTHAQRRRSCLSAPLHEVDVCNDQRVITAGLDSLFVQVADVCYADTGRDADAVIAAAQVLSSPPTVVRVGKRPVGVVPHPALQVYGMVDGPDPTTLSTTTTSHSSGGLTDRERFVRASYQCAAVAAEARSWFTMAVSTPDDLGFYVYVLGPTP